MSTTRRIWTCVLTIGVVLLAFAEDSRALGQEQKAYEKHDQAALYNSLREVINTGARMFNEDGDHAGCFQLYKGSLIAVRPFLAPDLQKSIDAALSKCDRLPSYGDRAFELRCVLDEIRAKTKPGDAKVEPVAETGQVAGKITYQGKAVPGGYFITLVASNGKKHSSALQKDGSFSFIKLIPVGEYRIVVEPIPGETIKSSLPVRYASETTSGLSIRVQAGKQQVDLNLVN